MKMKVESCPVCRTQRATSFQKIYDPFEIDGLTYQIVKCNSCNHDFTYFNSPVELGMYYDAGDYTVRDTRDSIYYKIQGFDNEKILASLKRLTPGRTLLDFGCGKGTFLSFAKHLGFNVSGVETSIPRASYAQETFNVPVNTDFYSEGQIFSERFAIITMFHVLEHLENVEVFIANLHRGNLNEDGVMVIEVPNFGSWQSKWAGRRWLHLDIPRHVNHFTDDSLKMLVEKSGLQIIKKENFSWHLGIIGMCQTLMSKFGYKGFLIGDLKKSKK